MRPAAGIIITTHYGIRSPSDRLGYFLRCLKSVLEYQKQSDYNIKILIHDNESNPSLQLPQNECYELTRIDNQDENGGLTGSWEMGSKRLITLGVDSIIFLNHDTIVNNSLDHMIRCSIENGYCCCGPMSNNDSNTWQYQKNFKKIHYEICIIHRINGFCWATNPQTLELARYSKERYFNFNLPFGFNEHDWQLRLLKNSGNIVLVKSAWIQHFRLRDWEFHQTIQQTPSQEFQELHKRSSV